MSNYELVGTFATWLDGCNAVGIRPPQALKPRFTRVPAVDERNGGKAGSILAFSDGKGCLCMNYRTGQKALVYYDYGTDRKITKAEISRRMAEVTAAREEERKAIEAGQRRLAAVAGEIYRCAKQSRSQLIHPYLVRKKLERFAGLLATMDHDSLQSLLKAHGSTQYVDFMKGRVLVIPLFGESGSISSLQFIDEEGRKSFLLGGKMSGSFWSSHALLRAQSHSQKVMGIAEGVATALAVNALYGVPCIAAMNAGNLGKAAKTVSTLLPDYKFRFYADKDASGIGEKEALAGWMDLPPDARAFPSVVVPDFTAEELQRWDAGQAGKPEEDRKGPTDFADLWLLRDHA